MAQFTEHHPADSGERGQEWSTVQLGTDREQGDQKNVLLASAKLHGSWWGDS